jgi:hypothetical protein
MSYTFCILAFGLHVLVFGFYVSYSNIKFGLALSLVCFGVHAPWEFPCLGSFHACDIMQVFETMK